MRQEELEQEEEYYNRVRHINGKFHDPNFDIDGEIAYKFAFFKGTLHEFDLLKDEHKDLIHLLVWEFETDEEIERMEKRTRRCNSQKENNRRNEEYRYLRSGYNTIR